MPKQCSYEDASNGGENEQEMFPLNVPTKPLNDKFRASRSVCDSIHHSFNSDLLHVQEIVE